MNELTNDKDELINKIPVGIGVFEIIDGTVHQRYMNDWFYNLVHDERESRNERHKGDFFQVIYSEDRKNVAGAINNVKNGSNYEVTTCRAIAANGDLHWIRLVASVAERREGYVLVYCSYSSMYEEMLARKELENKSELLEAAINGAEIGVWEYDFIKKKAIQTESFMRQTGYNKKIIDNVPESIIKSGIIERDSIESFRNLFKEFENSKRTVKEEICVKRWDSGITWWMKITLTPVFDDEERLIRGIATSMDITQQKKKEEHFRQQLNQMEELESVNLIAKGQHNLSKNKVRFYQKNFENAIKIEENDEYDYAFELLRASAKTDIGKHKIEQYLYRERLLEKYEKGIKEDSFVYRRYLEEDSFMWCEIKYFLSEEPDSHDVFVFIYSYDVTERIISEQIVQKIGEMEYDAFGIIDIRTGKYYLKNNNSLFDSNIFVEEGSYEQICREKVAENIVEAERESVIEKLRLDNVLNNLRDKTSYTFTYFINSAGERFRKQFQFSYLDDIKSSIIFCRRDITNVYRQEQEQLKITEEALIAAKKANKAKTDFMSNMSHDMRTPMNVILGMAQIMKEKSDLSDIRKDLEQIIISGHYLLNLINDTLDMNKIETGNLELHCKPMNSEEVFDNLFSTCILMAKEKNIQVSVKKPNINHGEWVEVLADAARVEQIFMNILSNAVKYTPENGKIEVIMETLEITDSMVRDRYTIKDNGIGMNESFIPRIFEPFSQEGRMNTERQNGTGLGMSIVKRLIQLMGGKISVNSKINIGTEVIIELNYPIAKGVVSKPKIKIDTEILKGKTVLVCEDHPLNSKIAVQLLEKKNIIVITAANGKEGLDIFKQSKMNSIDAILMDIRMPIMNGIEATKEIRKLERADACTVPIIAMTANAFEEDINECIAAGMNAHLTKPFDVNRLYEILSEYITYGVNNK